MTVTRNRGPKPEPRTPLEPFVGLSAAAGYLGYHTDTLRRLVREGRLPAYRIAPGADLRFKVSDLDALLKPA